MYEIYIDETGDNGLDFDNSNTQPWFLIAAIIIESKHRDELIQELDLLAKKYFNGGQIKSKNLKDSEKRTGFFQDLSKNNWHGVLLQVDKTLLDPDAFRWKKTFYKRVPRQLYNYLIPALNEVTIYPDPTGDEAFQRSLKNYFVERSPLDLFGENKIMFSRSIDCRINQLADICSGTKFRDLRDKTDYFRLVKSQFSIRNWPISFTNMSSSDVVIETIIDEKIAKASFNFAKHFIEKNELKDDPLLRDQVKICHALLDELINGDPFQYLSKKVLRNELSKTKMKKVGDLYLRTNVIGKLRTNDVMIVSNRKGGYKLPVSISEIEEYFANMTDKIIPMKARAQALENHVQTITGEKLFNNPKWLCLRKD